MADTHFSGPVDSAAGFNGNITGNVAGNLTGNVTGNVTGALTGNSAGTHTGPVVSSSLNLGSGGALVYAHKAAVTVDPGNVVAGASLEVSVTVTGAVAADLVLVSPPIAIEAGLIIGAAFVSAADTVKIRLFNSTGSDINPASGSWVFALIR